MSIMEELNGITCPKCSAELKFEPTDKENLFKGICPECGYEDWRALIK